MLQPLKRAGGRRHYRSEDIVLLQTINRLLNGEGYTIKGARKYLQNGGDKAGAQDQANGVDIGVTCAPPADSSGISVEALKMIRNRLANALAAA